MGYATRYVRRSLTTADGVEHAGDYDFVTEIDFPHDSYRDVCFAALADPATQALIVADEERLFDGRPIRTFHLAESAATLPPARC